MNIGIMLKKGVWAGLVFVIGYIAANPDLVMGVIPDNIENLTIGAAIMALIKMLHNWLKHKDD